jgi:signal transduction histidine kinase
MKQAVESTIDAARAGSAGALPADMPVIGHLDGLFDGLGIRSRIVLGQLPLTVTVVLVAVAAAVFSPATLATNQFQLALLAHTLLFAACLVLPWRRLPAGAFAAIPVLDCLAIGFTREAGGPPFNVLSLMLVFPVVWLAAQPRRYMVVLAILGTVLSTLVPSAVAGSPPTSASMIRTLVLPLILSAVAVTAHVVSRTIRHQRQKLVDKEHVLEVTLAESVGKQRLLDAVLGAVGIGVWVVDRNGCTVLTNKALQADPALATLPKNAGHGLLLPDRASAVPADASPIARAAAGDEFRDELYWAGGPQEQHAYGEDGGAVVTFVDVTTLIRALAAKDDFVSTVSHELRTPLTSILGYLELVLEEPGHEDIREELLVVHRNAGHLLALVNDLIAVASGRVDLSLEEADLAQLVTEVVGAAIPKASLNGLQLDLDAEQPLPARVDPGRIRQVVRNLLSNAVKYSPGGGRITVWARKSGGQLTCSISDSGVGMDAEEQEQAFTKFFRSARSRATAIPGAGLGLPVSKTIVEGHGGSITLASEPGKGTTVTFTLPAAS